MNLQPTIQFLRPYLSAAQLSTLVQLCRGEEGEFFVRKLLDIQQLLVAMPRTYAQSDLGDSATVHLHYFVGSCDWWITELDIEDGVSQAFGLGSLGYEPEMGYISITELIQNGAELDLYWIPKPVSEIRSALAV